MESLQSVVVMISKSFRIIGNMPMPRGIGFQPMILSKFKRDVRIFLGLLFIFSAPTASLASEGWYLLPEPKFMANEVVWPVPGSVQTVMLPVRIPDQDPEPLTRSQTKDPALRLEEIRSSAQKNASSFLASLKPRFIRSDRGAIIYAVLESSDPRLTSCVFAPEFTETFLETIGPDALIAIPNRSKIYVFPRSSVPGPQLSELVFIDFHNSNFPISREVFESKDGTLRAMGTLK